MVLSKKLKQLRSTAGMSQEQLADRLGVTRQAVVKWESGSGMPDIDNLQQLASVFGVRLDELLDYKNATLLSAVREDLSLADYPSGWQDGVIRERYPSARISQLIQGIKLSWWQRLLETVTIGNETVDMFHAMNRGAKDFYYLVEQNDRQWIVVVNKEYVEGRELTKPFIGKKMAIEGYRYNKVRSL